MSESPEKRNMVPAIVMMSGLLMYMAPAALAVATEFAAGDDPCARQHQPVTARDTDRLAELSINLMNDHTGGTCLLSSYGMSRDAYIDVMATVSADRRLSDAYNQAFEQQQR